MMEAVGKSMAEKTGTNETGEMVGRTVDQATGAAHKVIDKASGAALPAVERVAAGAHQAVDHLVSAATRATDTFDEKGGQLRDARSRFTESCRVHVREQPITSLGIAVAAGFLLSVLLRRR